MLSRRATQAAPTRRQESAHVGQERDDLAGNDLRRGEHRNVSLTLHRHDASLRQLCGEEVHGRHVLCWGGAPHEQQDRTFERSQALPVGLITLDEAYLAQDPQRVRKPCLPARARSHRRDLSVGNPRTFSQERHQQTFHVAGVGKGLEPVRQPSRKVRGHVEGRLVQQEGPDVGTLKRRLERTHGATRVCEDMHGFTDVADDRVEILHFAGQVVTSRSAEVVTRAPSPAVHPYVVKLVASSGVTWSQL